MKTIRNRKINRICYKLYSKYRKNVISLVTAAVLLVTSMPLADVSNVVSKMVSTLTNAITAMAADADTAEANAYVQNKTQNGQYTITDATDLQMLFKADAAVYADKTIMFAKLGGNFSAEDLEGITSGLGSATAPFKGKLTANMGSAITLPIDFALFDYLADSAVIDQDITIKRSASSDTALFAENVVHTDGNVTPQNWSVVIEMSDDNESGAKYSFTSVIGEMKDGSIANLTIQCEDNAVVSKTSGNAGLACGTMGKNAQLSVSPETSLFTVKAGSNAGSLVGEMSSGAKLTIDKDYSFTGIVTGKNAGGIVGKATDSEINIAVGNKVSISGKFVTTQSNTGGAGGVYGEYNNADEITFDFSQYELTPDFTNTSDATNFRVGGAFGRINNFKGKINITNSNENGVIGVNLDRSNKPLNVGGVVGAYYPQDKTDTELYIYHIKTKLTISYGNISILGGLIGNATNENNYKAYINVQNVEVNLSQQRATRSGGLFGAVKSAFVDIGGNVTIKSEHVTHVKGSTTTNASGSLIGICETNKKNNNNFAGVVRLSGNTDISCYQVENYLSFTDRTCNQLIGNRGDFLVYAVGNGTDSGWILTRNSGIKYDSDDMNWGEVLRLDGVNLTESEDAAQNRETDVLYFDKNDHSVTIKGFNDKNNVIISNKADFARVALIMQQTSNGFVKYSGSIDRNGMLSATINIVSDIDLTGTGITGFMRDGVDGNVGNAFSGKLEGGNNTITLAIGEDHGNNLAEGYSNGRIVKHTYNGLFSRTKGAIISNLKVKGTVNVLGANCTNLGEKSDDKACKIGGITAQSEGGLTLTNVTSEINWSSDRDNTIYAGGMVGYVKNANRKVNFTGCVAKPTFSYSGKNISVCIGGVISTVEYADTARDISFDDVTVNGSITQSPTSVSDARVGGLIGEIRAQRVAGGVYNNVSIKDVKIDGLKIDTNGKTTSGGFFGHNWYRTNVTLESAAISNSSLTTVCQEFGGLVTATTGYWKVDSLTFGEGVTISGGTNATAFGMLIDSTFGRNADPYLAVDNTNTYDCTLDGTYIEFVNPEGYTIDNSVSVSFGKTPCFDEVAAYSIHGGSIKLDDSNGQSVISLPAQDSDGNRTVIMDGKNCNTYQNRTKNNGTAWAGNSLARYYYNLDKYRENPNGDAQELLVWSVYEYAADNIKEYFKQTTFPTGDDFDLKGYSYYPVDADDVTISANATFKFYNHEINAGESASGDSDSYARVTTGSNDGHAQHYMMHHGLFRNVTDLTVSGKVTFSGSIGKTSSGSGVLVCGKVSDGDTSEKNRLIISGGITMENLYVNGYDGNGVAPLLINSIGSTTTVNIKNVATSVYLDKTGYEMNGQSYAASSLIGDVGNSSAQDIVLSFSGIKLAAGDQRLFDKATLMNSFQYSGSTSIGTYNYTYDEDWGKNESGEYNRNVTYGKEVKDSLKNSGQQNKYYGDWDADDRYTSPVKGQTSSAYNFSTGYLPYVAQSCVTNNSLSDSQYHEIDVNVRRPNINKGCGTYSDPYIINNGEQLATVANALNGTIADNWEVNYNAAVSPNNPTVDGKTAFCSTDKPTHEKYIYNGTAFVSEDGNSTVDADTLKKYLCEAYYLIDKDITLGKTFAGLGGTESDKVFRGVIIGKKDGTSCPTIINKSGSSLIRFSSGSVVKDLNIKNTAARELTKTDNAQISYLTKTYEIYGGVMAAVFGGDNIIDNVSVSQPEINFKTGSNNYLIPAGGYVGAVVYGGVIFRNMDTVAASSKLTIAQTAETDTQHLYVNPYIGRVVNGFAIEEGTKFGKSTTLDNGKKNYPITQFNNNYSDDEKLVIGNPKFSGFDVVKVPNAQALFMLSIISQSGMGYTKGYSNTCGYGWYTSTHTADYSALGSVNLTSDNEDYKNAISDYQRLELKNNKKNDYDNKISVMLKKYVPAAINNDTKTKYYEAKWSYDEGRNYTIKLTGTGDYDLTDTGFRGINQMFAPTGSLIGGIDNDYSFSFVKIEGTGQKIILDMDIKAYVASARDNGNDKASIDNYEYRNGIKGKPYATGIGLINATNKKLTVDNIALSGKIDIRTYDSENKVYANEVISTGAIAGTAGQEVNLTNINMDGLDIHGAYTTGSLLGKTYGKVIISKVTSTDNGISVYGGFECGGLVGSVQGNSGFAVSDSEIKLNKVEIDNALTVGIESWFGMGGVAGTSETAVTMKNVKVLSTSIDSFIGTTDKNGDPAVAKNMRVGGLIGFARSNATCTLENDEVNINLYGRVVGGMVGESSKEVTITSSCFGGENENSKTKVYGYLHAGGMSGYHTAKLTIEKSTVKNADFDIPAANDNNVGIGGYVGCKNSELVLKDCAVLNCEISSSDKSKTAGVGGIIGRNAGGTAAAYDILEDNIKYTRANANTSVGNLIGWNVSALTSKFIGVSVNNTNFSETVADSNNTGNSVNVTAIHTDYKGVTDNMAEGVEGENSKTHVEINPPYVNVNPAKTYAGITLTGDFAAGDMAEIVNAAASDSTASKKYQNKGVTSRANEIQAKYLSKLTNFGSVADQFNDDIKDMPILLVDDNSSVNITNMLSDYVSVLTNHDTDFNKDQSKLLSISIQTYKYENGSWTSSDDAKSLTYDESRHLFKTKNGVYDNDGTARFTLMTLDYADPTNAEQTAVRIHIPVFVKKVLDYSFTSKVLTGTDYDHSNYEDSNFAFESFGSPITTYFSFTYYRTAQEWQDAINGGDSLMWAFKKKIYLFGDKVGSGILPDGTQFTLVDTNREDKAYQAKAGEVGFDKTTGMLDMSKFEGFTAATLNDILLKYASVEVAEDTAGTLVVADSKDEATAQAYLNGTLNYFRAATEEELADASVTKYTATVKANVSTETDKSGRMKISESYYLTLTTPADTNALLIKNYVECTSGSKKLEGELPTNQISSDSNIATYIIANFLTQNVTITPTNDEEITSTNSRIKSVLNATITLNKDLKNTFIEYTQNGFDMYQAFKFSLKKYDASANGAAEQIVGGTSVNVDYSLKSESGDTIEGTAISSREMLDESKDYYMLEYPKSIWTQFLKDGVYTIQVQADMEITYDTSTMITQFPERKVEGDSTTGISVNATSMVAYNKKSTEKSSIAATAEEPTKHFYRRAMTAADLSYNVPESKVIEAKDSPYSQLGVNPMDMNSEKMQITAKGHYDLSELNESIRKQGKQIKFTLTLYKKNEDDKYDKVDDIKKYLDGISLTGKNDVLATNAIAQDASECAFVISNYNGEETYDITTKYNVITGKAFEDNSQLYANYKVLLTADLLDANGKTLPIASASDYIVYTNAKINTSFIER